MPTLGALITDDGRLAVMPTVLETFARAQSAGTAGYAPISGTPAFRSAVINDLFGDGPLADQAVSVATPGGTGAVYEAVVNFVEPGQSLLTASYYWGPYLEIARHSGRVLDTFEMFGSDGGFDVAGLTAALERHAALQGRVLLVLNFPCHNPTGYSLSPDEWKRTAEVVRDVGARVPTTLLLDAAYLRFGGDAEATWIDAVPTMLETATVLVAWTASKSFTQYGARVGALVGLHRDAGERDQITNALGYSCRATWSNGNHLGQAAIAELLTDAEAARRCDAERRELITLLQGRVDTFNEAAGRGQPSHTPVRQRILRGCLHAERRGHGREDAGARCLRHAHPGGGSCGTLLDAGHDDPPTGGRARGRRGRGAVSQRPAAARPTRMWSSACAPCMRSPRKPCSIR